VILFAAPFGLVRLLRERRPGARWIGGLLVYQLVLFYFLHVQSRYRLTLLPVLILGAVWAVQTLWRRGRAGELPVSGLDLAAGGCGAALLLYFAFGAT
jgi:O-antigen ligase